MRNMKGYRRNEGLEIIFEDDSLIVVNKPSGLLTMSTERKGDITAYSMLQDYYTEGRIFIVHRLDRDTSGLIVFAKDEETKRALQDNWEDAVRTYRRQRGMDRVMDLRASEITEGTLLSSARKRRQEQATKKGLEIHIKSLQDTQAHRKGRSEIHMRRVQP